jgi:tetratricopeptide (TPR) repeat protein
MTFLVCIISLLNLCTESGAQLSISPSPIQFTGLPTLPVEDYGDQFREFHMFSAKDRSSQVKAHFDSRPKEVSESNLRYYEGVGLKLNAKDRELMKRGLEFRIGNNFPAAIECFKTVASHAPKYWPVYMEWSDLLSLQHKYREAIECLNAQLKMTPGAQYGFDLREYCYFQLGRYEEGIADCNRSLKLNPHNAKAYRNRAAAYRMMHKAAEAAADDQVAEQLELPRKAQILVADGKFSEALTLLNTFIQWRPDDDMGRMDRGYLLIAMSRNQEAIADLNLALTRSLEVRQNCACRESAHAIRAKAYENLGEYKKAIDDYSVAINALEKKIDPKFDRLAQMRQLYPEYLRQRAQSYIRSKQPELAIPDCNKLVALNKTHASYYTLRGDAYAAAGKLGEALKDFTAASKLDPKLDYAYLQSARVAEATDQPVTAIQQYSTLLKLHPGITDFYLSRARHYERLQRYPESLADISNAIKLQPNNDSLYERRAEVYSLIGSTKNATSDYLKAIELNPKSRDTISKKISLLSGTTAKQ